MCQLVNQIKDLEHLEIIQTDKTISDIKMNYAI